MGNEQPRRRRAGLAVVDETAPDRRLHRGVQVRVRTQDEGGFTSELQREPLDTRGGELGDSYTGTGRPGEAHQVDLFMLDEDLAGLRTPPGHDVENARRESGLVRHVGEGECGQRATLLGLTTTVQPAASAGAALAAS